MIPKIEMRVLEAKHIPTYPDQSCHYGSWVTKKGLCRSDNSKSQLFCVLMLVVLGLLNIMHMPMAYASALEVKQLMQSMARGKHGQVNFVEKKFLVFLDKPVESSGTMSFDPPDTLELLTLLPKKSLMIIKGNELHVDHHEIYLQNHPDLLVFSAAVRGILTGDTTLLERFFHLSLKGSEDNWILTMSPTRKEVAKSFKYIRVNGSRNTITSIETLKTDQNLSLIMLTPAKSP